MQISLPKKDWKKLSLLIYLSSTSVPLTNEEKQILAWFSNEIEEHIRYEEYKKQKNASLKQV